MAIININIFSMHLMYNKDVTVILPDSITDEKLRCLWIYKYDNGYKDRIYGEGLIDIVNRNNIAVVIPDNMQPESNTIYEETKAKHKNSFVSYAARELPCTIKNMFRCISDKKKDNIIVGLYNSSCQSQCDNNRHIREYYLEHINKSAYTYKQREICEDEYNLLETVEELICEWSKS